jgi:hypothetical protein
LRRLAAAIVRALQSGAAIALLIARGL